MRDLRNIGTNGMSACPLLCFIAIMYAKLTIQSVMIGVYIRSDIRLSIHLAFILPCSSPSFLSTELLTLPIGTISPMIILITVLMRKLMINPGIVKCPDVSVPVSERNKLIAMLM